MIQPQVEDRENTSPIRNSRQILLNGFAITNEFRAHIRTNSVLDRQGIVKVHTSFGDRYTGDRDDWRIMGQTLAYGRRKTGYSDIRGSSRCQ